MLIKRKVLIWWWLKVEQFFKKFKMVKNWYAATGIILKTKPVIEHMCLCLKEPLLVDYTYAYLSYKKLKWRRLKIFINTFKDNCNKYMLA